MTTAAWDLAGMHGVTSLISFLRVNVPHLEDALCAAMQELGKDRGFTR